MQILIVDDSPVNLKVYIGLLSRSDYGEPKCFSSSAEALEWAQGNEFDLVIVDYNMPAPDGLEFVKLLRNGGQANHSHSHGHGGTGEGGPLQSVGIGGE